MIKSLILAGTALLSVQRAFALTYQPMEYVTSDESKCFVMSFKAYGEMTMEARVWIPEITAENTTYVLAGGGLWNFAVGTGNKAYYCVNPSKYGNWGWTDYTVESGTWLDIKTENFATGYNLYVKSPSTLIYGEPVYTKTYAMTPVTEEEATVTAILGQKSGNNVLKKMPSGTKLAWIKFWRKGDNDILTEVADLKPYVDEDGFEYLKDRLTGAYTMASGVSRTRYFVNGDSGSDGADGTTLDTAFKTLEYAINTKAAAKSPCIVRICGDHYPITYSISSSLSISSSDLAVKGETGRAEDVIIDSNHQDFTPISFGNVTDSRVESLTIRNGYHSKGIGALQLRGTRPVASNIVVTGCKSTTTSAHMGVVMLNWGGTLQDSKILFNTNSSGGGIVMLSRAGRVERCVIANNVNGSMGGGVSGYHGSGSFDGSNGMIVDSCVITNNEASYGGGVGDVAKVVNSRIENNRCTTNGSGGYGGGGVYIQTTKFNTDFLDVFVTNCVVASNDAPDGGGGICLFNASVSNVLIDACCVTNNTVKSGYRNRGGAGIQSWPSSQVEGGVFTLRNSLVYSNRFSAKLLNSQGSGILANVGNGKMRVENCTISENLNYGAYQSAFNVIGSVELVNVAVADNRDADGNVFHGLTTMPAGASKTDDGSWAANISYSLLHPAEATWTFSSSLKIKNGVAPRFYQGTGIPRSTSPLRDAGTELAWHAGANDLHRAAPRAGEAVGLPVRKRVIRVVDIGCYEYDLTTGMMVILK